MVHFPSSFGREGGAATLPERRDDSRRPWSRMMPRAMRPLRSFGRLGVIFALPAVRVRPVRGLRRGLAAHAREHGRERVQFYGCTSFWKRGAKDRTNNMGRSHLAANAVCFEGLMGSTTNCSGSWNVLSPEAHKARRQFQKGDRHAPDAGDSPAGSCWPRTRSVSSTARHADIEMNDAPAAANYESFTRRQNCQPNVSASAPSRMPRP